MIRKLTKEDKPLYLTMTEKFYCSEAVHENIPEKYRMDTFEELMRSEDYLSCYIMEHEGTPAGYALLAKTFSQEAGGIAVWIEELYVEPAYRSKGLGHEFFAYLEKNIYPHVKRIRLEAEGGNSKAISLYQRMGFTDLPYSQLVIDL